MCERYQPCKCLLPRFQKRKRLTVILLDCWQREYDSRPYRHFQLKFNDFFDRMARYFIPHKDFPVVVEFFQKRLLFKSLFTGINCDGYVYEYLHAFASTLTAIKHIEFKLCNLPAVFFRLLMRNSEFMVVRHLSFEGTPLTTSDIEAIREFLIQSKTISYLNVSSCQINLNNFALIADGIHKCDTMRGFSCNRILGTKLYLDTHKISHTVSSLIWQNKLEDIELQFCDFVARDMDIMAEYLAIKESKLLRLNVANNRIGSDGAEYLLRAISKSGTLTHLDISVNGLLSHGGRVVAKYLSSCFRLEYLNIGINNICCDVVNLILTAMKKPVKLKSLKIYGNKFDSKSATIVKRLLDSLTVPQEVLDISVTYDESLEDYRIIPYF